MTNEDGGLLITKLKYFDRMNLLSVSLYWSSFSMRPPFVMLYLSVATQNFKDLKGTAEGVSSRLLLDLEGLRVMSEDIYLDNLSRFPWSTMDFTKS